MSKTAEYALDNLCRSMGQAERNEQARAMQRACDTATLKSIVADNRNPVHLPADPTATVTPQGAGRVIDGSGWAESRPLRASGGDGWAYMTPEERAERARLEKERRAKGQS
jgi:hypothetical protein